MLANLPEALPELGFERARNAMRQGDVDRASDELDKTLAQNGRDVGTWALAELCWRAKGDARHEWLCPDRDMFRQSNLALSDDELATLTDTLKGLHVTRSAPLGQSVEGGTQTHGNLRLRRDPIIARLFEAIDTALADYVARLPKVDTQHPLAALQGKPPEIIASWSILLASGGRHVPHLHDGGRVSSAAHIAIPEGVSPDQGALELGRPPEDIPLDLGPLVQFSAKPGHLVLFPSYVYHATTRFPDGERLTVAFDAI